MPKKKKETAEIEDPREVIENLERISKKLEKNIKEIEKAPKKRRKRRKKKEIKSSKSGYLISIILNGILWYLANNYLPGNIIFLTYDFSRVLPFFNISLIAGIIGNFILLLTDDVKVKNFIKIVVNLSAMLFIYQLYSVFPFNLSFINESTNIDFALKIGLIGTIVGLGVATIIETLALVFED